MQNREQFMEQIMGLDVLDTHTHLIGDRLAAGSFWDIAHYFWLHREMQAAGYPADADQLPEAERIEAFLSSYRATRNTLMNWVVTQIFRQLYQIELTDADSVRAADAAVRASAEQSGWAQQVADKLHIRRFVVNVVEHADFQGMDHKAVLIPRIDGRLHEWVQMVHEAEYPEHALAAVRESIDQLLVSYKERGCPGMMTTLPGFGTQANAVYCIRKESPKDEILMTLLHTICSAAQRSGLFVQLFLGVERSWCGTAVPVNDPYRIVKLSGLFDQYKNVFELVVASEINNLDTVQAAWNFPNVQLGGLWWFNFRASTYRSSMQYRLEALPAAQCSLIASDARCIEWSYGKILLVKRLLAEFLYEQIEKGWLDETVALQVAEEWLYKSAARRYGVV
ncbi:glucuronate isomerase [Paenibacillus sp. TAB 01]|uniref:glucuronate isomerase n=1 Tax=Paenibacillus sp. TAB 01 TaxID=3368988 RepID=UPI0037512B0E